MSDFGTRLKSAIKNAGMTQNSLADALGIKQQSVQYLCSGKARTSKHILDIGRILNVSPEWLINGQTAAEEKKATYAATAPVKVYTAQELDSGDSAKAEFICPFPHSAEAIGFVVGGSPTTNPMHPRSGRAYPTGSIVFAEPATISDCKSGDLVLAKMKNSGAHIFRELIKEHDQHMLNALNPMFEGTKEPFEVVGKVIGAILP
ncbi:MAG TPA: hypothetical protein DCZ12_02050 [Gammaproteobacteria bacterium]|nr:hypothetical protein [Gammaproteobacteria bacterium]